MEYLLKASGLVIIFYTCYKIFLQRETFFEHNRWFLLLGLITSFIIPFLVIPIYIEQEVLLLENFNITENIISIENKETPFNILDYLPMLYFIGVIAFSLRFIFQLSSLIKLLIKNKVEHNNGYRFVKTTSKEPPFSFFKWIVYNPSQFKVNELEHIITHEKVHVNQYHSIDVLLSQIANIVIWFNPIIWFYNKDLKQNLEFIADKLTQNKIDCKKSYQYTLLKTSVPSHQLAITNKFYNSLIKKRIIMLHKSKSKKSNHFKYLLILPFLCLFIMSFNTQEIINNKATYQSSVSNNPINYGDHINIYISKDITDNALDKIKTDLEEKGYTLKISGIKRNIEGYIISINISINYKKSHNTNFISNSTNPIKTIKIVIDNKDNSISIGNSGNHVLDFGKVHANAQLQTGENPLYVIDGKIIKEKGFTINKYDVESVNVLKGKKAIEKYGDQGKNGVIEITNKSKNLSNNKINLKSTNGEAPLYILNDKEITQEIFDAINPDDIKSMSVLKGDKAIEKYANKGLNGVVIISTKKQKTLKLDKLALYIIDGNESSYEESKKINSLNIESINVFKDEMAILKYGDKGKNGVIEITTKK